MILRQLKALERFSAFVSFVADFPRGRDLECVCSLSDVTDVNGCENMQVHRVMSMMSVVMEWC